MAFLSSLFGSDDSDSTNASSSDLFSDIDAVLGVDISNENYSQSTDEDGSSETSWSAQHFGTDLDLGSVLDSMTDQFSDVQG
jgi:hypothetical protein